MKMHFSFLNIKTLWDYTFDHLYRTSAWVNLYSLLKIKAKYTTYYTPKTSNQTRITFAI